MGERNDINIRYIALLSQVTDSPLFFLLKLIYDMSCIPKNFVI